jgi:WD40 repeat protein/serine/threonine protein kinase
MNPEARKVRDVFVAAVKVPTEKWEAFLEKACAGDNELRGQVSDLLQAHQEAGSFLDQPAAVVRTTDDLAGPSNGVPAASEQEAPGTTIGPYKLLEEIGEGGMGTVWMAEQRQPVQRKVALKIVKAGMDTRQVIARFEAERQALALMDHPNIATVFDGGTTSSGRPYFVMELVKGVPITKYCDEHRLTPRQRLELFLPVCQAIQHAHTKGIIHRDIKPANILVAPYDGRPVPKVIDFGVAKATGQRLTERTLFTAFGAVVGTLEYMSPDQAELNNQDIDIRSDIYSLGVLLYELLTGTTPLGHERVTQVGFAETLRLIREEDAQRPSTRLSASREKLPAIAAQRHMDPAKLTRALRGELDWVVMKALEKNRDRRYETANSLARDLERYLHDEPVLACPPSLGYRLGKLVGLRRPRVRGRSWAAAAAVLVLVVSGLGMTEATGVTRLAATVIRFLTPEGILVVKVDDPSVKVTIEGDGGLVITGAGPQEVRLRPGSYRLQADKNGKPIPLNRELVTISRGDKQVVTVSLDASRQPAAIPREQPLAPGEVRRFVGHTRGINGLAVSRDGRYILSGARDRTVRLWELETGKEIRRFEGHTYNVSWVALSPDGRRALSISHLVDPVIRFWDIQTGKELPFWKLPAAYAVAFSPDGHRFLTSDHEYKLHLWDLASGEELQCFEGHTAEARSVAFSPNGRLILSGSRDKTMRLWDAETGKELRRFEGHRFETSESEWWHAVWSVTFSPDGRRALSCAPDSMRLWDVKTGREIRRFEHSPQDMFCYVCFSPVGQYALSGGNMGVRLWDIESGSMLRQFQGHTARVENVAFTPDGRYALSAAWDGDNTIRLWELPIWKLPKPKK